MVLDVRLRTHSTGVSGQDRPSAPGTLRPPGKRAVRQPEKRKADSSILSLTTGFGLISSPLTSVNADLALACLQSPSDYDCPCVTVVCRSLSHADRTSRLGSRITADPRSQICR
jgi:hypothetical protein